MREPTFSNTIDLISRQAEIDALDVNITVGGRNSVERVKTYIEAVRCRLKQLPSVTLKCKQGKWEQIRGHKTVFKCNRCGNFLDFDGVNAGRGDANFCPNCGAKMSGGEQDGI